MRRRKLLSLFLSLCLCLSLLPTAVLAEDVQAEPLTEVAVTFPAPKAGENISEAMKAASGNADSGLTLYLTGPALWKQGEEPDKLDENAVYAEGNTYLLNFTFYTQKPITDETVLTCNGKPITRYADYRALTEALDAYDGTQDACLAFVMFSEDGIGDPSMAEVKNVYVVGLSTFVRVPKTLTTAEAATADALRTAIGTGTDDIVKLTGDITIGAGLKIARDVTVDLNGCVLRYDETADPDSIFRVAEGHTLTLTDSRPTAEHEDETLPAGGVITGGKGYMYDGGYGGQHYYQYYGGSVYVESNASFVLAGGTIYACGVRSGATSAFGGGICCMGGSVTVTGGAIRNCAVSADYGASGGAIYAKAGSVTMSGGVISGCSAKDGGGILTSGCTVQITGGRIENCKASGCGGGLFVSGHTNGPVSVLDTVISGCEAKRGGGLALIGFAELELGENARITGCTATETGDTEAGAIEYGAAIYMDLESTYTINYPGCFLYANGGRVEGSVYVGRNGHNQDATIKATNAIDHTDGQPTVFTGDVYCEGDIRGGSFYGSVTVLDPYERMTDTSETYNLAKFCSNLSGGSFYGPVYTECYVSGGTYYAGLTLEKNAKLSGKPINTGGVLNDKINTPDPNGKPVTVTYGYGELGGIYAKQIVQTGETAIRPTDPKVNGFTFCGWYTDAGCTDGNEYDFTVPVTADFTLYAKWEGTYYGIRITDKDGNAVYVTNKNSTNVLGDGTVVYVPGYWNEEDIPAEYWADDTHTILTAEAQEKLLADGEIPGIRLPRLTLNGAELQEIAVRAGWGADPQTQILNTFLQLELMGKNSISNSEERGAGIYCPLGLYLIVSGDGSLDVTADYAISTEGGGFYQRGGEVTLSARQVGIAHSYSHYIQFYGGKLTIQVTSTESNDDYGVLPFHSDDIFHIMDGATFRVGNSAEDNVLITLPSSDEFKPADIFDQWAEKVTTNRPYYLSLTANYTVTFDTDGGSEVASQTVPYGGQAAVPVAPAKPGYTFAGWTPAIPETMPAENLTIKAKWTVNQYTLTFDTDGGSAIAPITQDYGTAVTAPADPTRTGYTFAGWTPEIPAAMPAEDLTIKAKWTVNQYTLTFDTDGGSAIAPITQDYGTAVTAPADPTRTGYTFAGWTPEIPAAMPAEDLTIKAKWTVNTYTITYDLDGGTAEGNPASYTVESGAITLAEPAKPGYTFTGWSGTDLEGADNRSVTIPAGSTGDRSYTAHWQVNTVYSTLRFETRGGSALATLALPYGSRVDLTKYVPTREGFAFTGWYTDRELTQRVTSLTLTNSTVVYAGWNPFTDVGSSDWFYEDVLYVYNQGLMEGTGADTFSPDAAVTRGQVVTILWRMAGSPAVNFAMNFSDVTEDTWCAEAIRWAASEGIAKGFADGSFGQDVYVSREQLAAFLYREVQRQGGGFTGMWYFPLNYPDIEELGAFADEAMHWCVMTGVLQGTADGRLAPKATADRAQLSAILHRYLTVEK